MPDTKKVDTVRIKRRELADLLGVSGAAVSRAVHQKFYCGGFPIWEWAEWHPRGNQIEAYEVPKWAVKDLADQEEWPKYDIFDGHKSNHE